MEKQLRFDEVDVDGPRRLYLTLFLDENGEGTVLYREEKGYGFLKPSDSGLQWVNVGPREQWPCRVSRPSLLELFTQNIMAYTSSNTIPKAVLRGNQFYDKMLVQYLEKGRALKDLEPLLEEVKEITHEQGRTLRQKLNRLMPQK